MTFALWLQTVARPLFGDGVALPHYLPWLLAQYENHGAVTAERLGELHLEARLVNALEAIEVLRADLKAVNPIPELDVEVTNGIVQLLCDGRSSDNVWDGVQALAPEEAKAECASLVQEILAFERLILWPRCPLDGNGLTPDVIDEQAQWICRARRHAVARIGRLSEALNAAGDSGRGP